MADEEEELVYTPDMIPDEKGDKVYCFIVPERACGPDCMAFLKFGGERPTKTNLDDNQQNCTLLVNADRLARHVVIIASLLSNNQKKKRTAEQDKQREASTPATGPFSGPAPLSPFPVEKPGT